MTKKIYILSTIVDKKKIYILSTIVNICYETKFSFSLESPPKYLDLRHSLQNS